MDRRLHITKEQKKIAAKTRALVAEKIGTWQHIQSSQENPNIDIKLLERNSTIVSRGLSVQWVEGNAEKAETSFFKINTQGTALDDIEELLLANRRKPIAIAARAIIRSGMGHRYWSKFETEIRDAIEVSAKKIHDTLFQPELETPVKTLDLPLGGSTGVRSALQVLIEFTLAANRNQLGDPKLLKNQLDDIDGSETQKTLTRAHTLASRISGNEKGSLGLHPAIYFYGPTGRHQVPMFLGISILFGRKIINNDKIFFEKFTSVRGRLEDVLIQHKDLIATVLQRTISKHRINKYADLIDSLISHLDENINCNISEEQIVTFTGLTGKIITGNAEEHNTKFSDETKSAVFIKTALKSAIRCPFCMGYLDVTKSVSYDHITEKASGGKSTPENCQLTHPYCNQSAKNKIFQNTSE